LRGKAQVKSVLDEIKGIGPTRRKALMTYFNGDVDRIKAATMEELLAVPGMNRRSAEAVKQAL
jgi:excinuclease ABC subunit C